MFGFGFRGLEYGCFGVDAAGAVFLFLDAAASRGGCGGGGRAVFAVGAELVVVVAAFGGRALVAVVLFHFGLLFLLHFGLELGDDDRDVVDGDAVVGGGLPVHVLQAGAAAMDQS